ncbi:MAG: hypothetical protein HYX68_00245 [Planctomycetes bacterium]|jgi:alpha-galactosidase|nr:hypothetical protein [Planctomycetota bacterium]
MLSKAKLFSAWVALLFAAGSVLGQAQGAAKKKLQIFILAGQSNMVGHANYVTLPAMLTSKEPGVNQLAKWVFKEGAIAPGDARTLLQVRIRRDQLSNDLRAKKLGDPAKIAAAQAELKKLQADFEIKSKKIKDAFTVSRRVYITSVGDGHRRSGPLTIGFGGSADKIGPELGFGLALEKRIDAPILLIKTSWGGKSLHYNFRPPSAGPYELSKQEQTKGDVKKIKENAGLNYRMMNKIVHDVLRDLKKYHPEYDAGIGYEIAGFVWFQGFNDQFSPAFRDNYKNNMIAFIKDVRKEYQVPDLPFVIGVMGTGATKESVDKNAVSVAQRQAAARPEFKGNVAAVESYRYYDLDALAIFRKGWAEHLLEFSLVGSDRPYHYMGSGTFFVRLGDAFATAMVDLRKKQ